MGQSAKVTPHHTFTPSSTDLAQGHMKVTYCASTNTYILSGSQVKTHDWETGNFCVCLECW